KAAREYCDELAPKITDLEVRLKRRLLEPPLRGEIENRYGQQVTNLWESDVASFDPVIEGDLIEQSRLSAEYNELLASAKLAFQGDSYNLSEIAKFHESPDRQTRYDSQSVVWSWFAAYGERLDAIYDAQVTLRARMAEKLGYADYIALAYRLRYRIGYGRGDIEQFRDAVRTEVVPLATRLRSHQGQRLGVDRLMYWDEPLIDPQGNPRPQGDHDWMIKRAAEMFDAMSPQLSRFFHLMHDRGLMDLKVRNGKAGGGFCTSFARLGIPYIFANFNGTKGDVEVFTHEMGHAFQNYSSRDQPLIDYLWPTIEACEIHSMGLEYLTWPHMEKFFGADATRFRQLHLMSAMYFLPYGVAVDHFQHLVYANPSCTPAERHEMWLEMEATYLPWRDNGDVPYLRKGGRWQLQRHIYLDPFYYIDYTLAEVCALQFWRAAQADPDDALNRYIHLCHRGGEAPFIDLVESAGLESPFAPGVLGNMVDHIRVELS
ncbi:MAG: M3 family oligoendopeptidase, partial [Planctomycetales bacterium]|nr:M3 family oligoendopeptidase [Planctomycetales bacterium]